MSFQVALSELRSRTLLRADMINSSFRTSTTGGEVDKVINANWRKAYRLVVLADDDYAISSQDYTMTSSDTYALPADFFKERKLESFVSGISTGTFKLRKFRLDELSSYQWSTSGFVGFRLRGDNFVLAPAPNSGDTLRLWYIPAPASLTADGNTIDAVHGIDELIVLGSARDLLVEEGDTEAATLLTALYDKEEQRVLADMQHRAEPEQAADVIGTGPGGEW